MAEAEIIKSVVLIVDDEEDHAQVMCDALSRLGHKCDVAYSLAEALSRLERKQYDVVVTDLRMGDAGREGLDVLGAAKELQDVPPAVILVTAVNDVPTSRQAIAQGAYDYITKPLDLEVLRAQVNRAAEKSHLAKQNQILREQVGGGFEGIIGRSVAMRQVLATARQVAQSDIPVLILGESGTGKELIAKAIHNNSRRRKQRLVTMNCAGMPETILESELFGHVRGAFTDARTERAGRFEHADKGTLFMDEIGDMPQNMQAKLLRVLENGEVVRLGSNDPIKTDVRLISATNKNLEEMVADKQFREDLYYRIKGIAITLPPLRERREDIPLLIHFFVQQFAAKANREIDGVAAEAQHLLMAYGWPGNVRELRNAVETMMVMSSGPTIGVESLPKEIRPAGVTAPMAAAALGAGGDVKGLQGLTMEQVEREHIRSTLELTQGNREQAAKILGIGERTLYRKIKEYGL
ncbi:MAG: sigma-54-dependent transcriptional regulator [Phycisphaerae bacterium]|nr:sigma-54 dependent transcriptional regulator [Tepidisphaeraceae bacterium]